MVSTPRENKRWPLRVWLEGSASPHCPLQGLRPRRIRLKGSGLATSGSRCSASPRRPALGAPPRHIRPRRLHFVSPDPRARPRRERFRWLPSSQGPPPDSASGPNALGLHPSGALSYPQCLQKIKESGCFTGVAEVGSLEVGHLQRQDKTRRSDAPHTMLHTPCVVGSGFPFGQPSPTSFHAPRVSRHVVFSIFHKTTKSLHPTLQVGRRLGITPIGALSCP